MRFFSLSKVILILAMLSLSYAVAAGENEASTPIDRSAFALEESTTSPVVVSSSRDSYHGILRIYIEEPISRYRDFTNKNYHFGFLGFAVNQEVSVNDGEVLSDTVIWNVGSLGAVSQSNIEAIAVLFNAEGHAAFSSPSDNTFPFTAHYVDAAASSLPGIVGIDDASGSYTHTVFLEEATAST